MIYNVEDLISNMNDLEKITHILEENSKNVDLKNNKIDIINNKSTNGRYALHIAIEDDYSLSVIKLLLNNSANINHKNKENMNCLKLLQKRFGMFQKWPYELAESFRNAVNKSNIAVKYAEYKKDYVNHQALRLTESILQNKIDVMKKIIHELPEIINYMTDDPNFFPPLIVATRKNCIEPLNLLLEQENIDIEIISDGDLKFTALASASLNNDIKSVELLIKHGANVNCVISQHTAIRKTIHLMECSLLHLCAAYSSVEVVRLLIEAGANVNSLATFEKSQENRTVLDFALKNQCSKEMVDFLRSKGARKYDEDHDTLLGKFTKKFINEKKKRGIDVTIAPM